MEAVGKDLVAFWDWAASKGLMNKNTAGGLKAACKEVLEAVDGDDWQTTDLKSIDPDHYGQRFEKLRSSNFKPNSLVVYKSRFKNGTKMFLDYLDNPSGWRYKAERPASARRKSASSPGTSSSLTSVSPETSSNGSGQEMIQYPYPLRPDLVVHLTLPRDLTKTEAKRLAGYLDSLAFEETKMLPAGATTN